MLDSVQHSMITYIVKFSLQAHRSGKQSDLIYRKLHVFGVMDFRTVVRASDCTTATRAVGIMYYVFYTLC